MSGANDGDWEWFDRLTILSEVEGRLKFMSRIWDIFLDFWP